MKFIFGFLLLGCLSCTPKINQKAAQTAPMKEVVVAPLKKDSFPLSWFGTWAGTLDIFNAKGLAQSVPMQLEIGPTDTAGVYNWAIIYGNDRAKGLRPYLLRTVNAAKGHYQTDELNSIKLDAYLLGDRLFSTYVVQGNLLTSIEERRGDTLTFEIIFGKETPTATTGGQTIQGEDIPEVKSLPVMVYQKAILRRQK